MKFYQEVTEIVKKFSIDIEDRKRNYQIFIQTEKMLNFIFISFPI